MSTEAADFFFDNVQMEGSGAGTTLIFTKHIPRPVSRPEVEAIGRTSWENLKVVTYALTRFIKEAEKKNECVYPVSKSVLVDNKIPQEDWNAFWKPDANPKL